MIGGLKMLDLNKFKPFDFTEGVPYISITENGITFSKGVVSKLGRPPRVEPFREWTDLLRGRLFGAEKQLHH